MTLKKSFQAGAVVLSTLLFTQIAAAHPGHNGAGGFAAGATHPIFGLDHLLAMLAVGLCAVSLGGRALWQLPLAFLGAMLAAGTLGINGPRIPYLDHAIACSVLLLGLSLALQWKLPIFWSVLTVALFGAFHGYAHAAEIPQASSVAGYALGFTLATTTLLVAGIFLGSLLRRLNQQTIWRFVGAGIAASGMVFFLIAG